MNDFDPESASSLNSLTMHRIFIVDDHPMMRSGLRELLTGEKKYEICGEAATARASTSGGGAKV